MGEDRIVLQYKRKMKTSLIRKIFEMPIKTRHNLFTNVEMLKACTSEPRHSKCDRYQMGRIYQQMREEIKQESGIGGHDVSQIYKFVIDYPDINPYRGFRDLYLRNRNI